MNFIAAVFKLSILAVSLDTGVASGIYEFDFPIPLNDSPSEPNIRSGVDLSSLVFVKRSERYYVTLRADLADVPMFVRMVQVRFAGTTEAVTVGMHMAIKPVPRFSESFLESMFRHFAGLPMIDNPSLVEVRFLSVIDSSGDSESDLTFGDLPIGHVSMRSVEASFATNPDVRALFSSDQPPLVLIRMAKVAYITRLDWLLNPSHKRFLFRRIAIQDPSVTDLGKATSFVFIDARVWNGALTMVSPFLTLMTGIMEGTREGFSFKVAVAVRKPWLATFLNGFNDYLLSNAGGSTDFMNGVSVNLVDGESTGRFADSMYYEVVSNTP